MEFKILDRWGNYPRLIRNRVYLTWDSWNDYNYYTTFGIFYIDHELTKHSLGVVMLGFIGQQAFDRVYDIGHTFNYIGDNYFSLGSSENYYENLKNLSSDVSYEILNGLNDLALKDELFEFVKNESVVRTSFLRSLSETTISGQFRRIVLGGARLTSYSFTFIQSHVQHSEDLRLFFDVQPDSLPPTNVHVIIGRNGVGKTYLINNMIDSLIVSENQRPKGSFVFGKDENNSNFANAIHVSFSAFDEIQPRPQEFVGENGLKYSHIGLWHFEDGRATIKNPAMLPNDFYESLCFCKSRGHKERWIKAVTTLQSDPNFRESGIIELIDLEDSRSSQAHTLMTFRRLSSGHKIILLTITKLIEKLQERSLVIMDEPEAHLHPPLLSAFIRTVSDLLSFTNGVAIIATHSPVILQEVPSSCVWRLRRSGVISIVERLNRESFGENVGILTNEIFGLEVTESGFYKLLSDVARKNDYDFDTVLIKFNFQLGMEAKSILMALVASNNN